MKSSKLVLLCALSGAAFFAFAGQSISDSQHKGHVTALRLMENGNLAFSLRYAPEECGGHSTFSFEFNAKDHTDWIAQLQSARAAGKEVSIRYLAPAAYQTYCTVTQVD